MLGATRSKSEREILAGGAKRFDVQGGVSEFLLYLSSRIRKLRQADVTIRVSPTSLTGLRFAPRYVSRASILIGRH
jgi:hypothetical protein